MLRPIRTVISLAFIAGLTWVSFSVKLGELTFAEHIDRIGQTPEARQLLEDTRATVNPVVQEATDRMLGEHVEAPTWSASDKPEQQPKERRSVASTEEHTKLPGH